MSQPSSGWTMPRRTRLWHFFDPNGYSLCKRHYDIDNPRVPRERESVLVKCKACMKQLGIEDKSMEAEERREEILRNNVYEQDVFSTRSRSG